MTRDTTPDELREFVAGALADLLAGLNEADQWLGAARSRRRYAAAKNAMNRLLPALLDAQAEAERLRGELADYKEAYADTRRLAREIDVGMHGEDMAAPTPSLCDLVADAASLRARADRLEGALRPFAEAAEKAEISGRPPFEFCGADDYEGARSALSPTLPESQTHD